MVCSDWLLEYSILIGSLFFSFFLIHFHFFLTTEQQQQKIWRSVFYWVRYFEEPSLEWENSKYITYTKFTDARGNPKIVGYVQFRRPVTMELLETMNPQIYWTLQRFSSLACMRYIEKINKQENGVQVTLGEHWPIKPHTLPGSPPTQQAEVEEKKLSNRANGHGSPLPPTFHLGRLRL